MEVVTLGTSAFAAVRIEAARPDSSNGFQVLVWTIGSEEPYEVEFTSESDMLQAFVKFLNDWRRAK